jgi:cell wall-associated NlpC family hydrolase
MSAILPGPALASAAEALVGTRFRLHGRDPATGLDCLGVLAAALAAIGRDADLPQGYTLKLRALPALDRFVQGCGLATAAGPILPGDVVLARVSPIQFHLAVAGHAGRIVHAHVGLGRVIAVAGPLPWPLVHHWRPN